MKALACATVLCVAVTMTCDAMVSAASFAVFVITAAVYSWRQSKKENR